MQPLFYFAVFIVLIVLGVSRLQSQTAADALHASVSAGDEPVFNEPYSAKSHFTSGRKNPDGTISHEESEGSEARDSSGRTYSVGERHFTYMQDGKGMPGVERLYRISDPVAHTETRWSSLDKEVKVMHWQKEVAASRVSSENCQCGPILPPAQTGADIPKIASEIDGISSDFFVFERLGPKRINGVDTQGIRRSYEHTGETNQNATSGKVVHEDWYSPDLRIVILETNDDPEHGKTVNELTEVRRGEPDVTSYKPPPNLVIKDKNF